ncbi:MAG: hypothetical protein OXF31_10195 [Gammaproteobacteria bacterium]|nr:hypothetical protein [Gammaproteobacteria bacterium]
MPKPKEARSFWTWGYVSDEPSEADRARMAKHISGLFGEEVHPPPVPSVDDIEIRPPRINVPEKLRSFVSVAPLERITHTHGGHVLELLDALRGKFPNPPDAVAHPRNEDELEAVFEWCQSASVLSHK